MNAQPRRFTAELAVRSQVPLLVGLMGPSGGGKTFSALRLATGIQQVSGGDIYVIDTESRRALHYADQFKFRHVPFEAPFGSLDYLEALRFCVQKGAGVVVVDSMSHEHEGPGGLLDLHEQELNRLAGDNYGKREAMKMLAWGTPKANRRKLINGLLQMNANFIFCFRAKNSVKPVKVQDPETGRSKTEVVPQGFMPIAGDEFVFEMTMNALLLPGADGFPTWASDNVGEKTMIKLPKQFRGLLERPRQLDEKLGVSLAKWARGGASDEAQQGDAPRQQQARARDQAPQDDGFPGDRPTDDAQDEGGGFGGGDDGDMTPAAQWAQGVRDDLEADAFDSVAAIDKLTSDPAQRSMFQDYAQQDAEGARRLEAAIKGRRKALASREQG